MADQRTITISVSDEIFEMLQTCKMTHLNMHLINAEGKEVQVQFDFSKPTPPELVGVVH